MELHNALKRVSDIISSTSEAAVAVLDEEGYPHVSQRSLIHPTTIGEVYFSSNRKGNLHRRIEANGRTGLTFPHEEHNVTFTGMTEVITDTEIKRSRWLDWFDKHFSGGPEGEEFTLFRFTTERISLWLEGEPFYLNREDIFTVDSYCGLYCSRCSFREEFNCPGCLRSAGNPFWGSCPVGSCAEKRGIAHCGHCPDGPCEKLTEYSCGEGEHSDNPKGARLEVMKLWKG